MIETLNHYGVDINGTKVKSWVKCSTRQDRTEKKDIVAMVENKETFGQLKFRQPNSGDDIGVELVIPYNGKEEIQDLIRTHNTKYLYEQKLGRDVKFKGELYVCSNNTLSTLRIIKHSIIKKICKKVFLEWAGDPDPSSFLGNSKRIYRPKSYPATELRFMYDRGFGYRGGDSKIMLFIPYASIADDYKTSVELVAMPDYVQALYLNNKPT